MGDELHWFPIRMVPMGFQSKYPVDEVLQQDVVERDIGEHSVDVRLVDELEEFVIDNVELEGYVSRRGGDHFAEMLFVRFVVMQQNGIPKFL